VLLGVGRIAAFTIDMCPEELSRELKDQLQAVSKDVASLSDYETHLSDKAQFLLDAVLGNRCSAPTLSYAGLSASAVCLHLDGGV
jgi:hypothetical protein